MLNIPQAVLTGAAAYTLGTPLLGAIAAGFVQGLLNVKAGPSLKRRDVTPTPFKYVSSYHKELF
jgi:hypothetical protein